jgi:dTDP-4-amino-4,6-dideoxygalactose transaminase
MIATRRVLDSPFRFIRPTLPPLAEVVARYLSVYDNGLITNAELVARFERAAADRLGVAHCVAVSSCTAGLMLSMRALDLTGEVILPSFTFFASGHPVLWNGLTPVFADCDANDWTLDPDDVERRITPRTSAILAVHMYGNPCRVERLEALAARYRLKLIFDAAHAFGSRYQGRPIGQFGDAEVFSFSPTKLLVAGEGGLVSTNDATLAHRLRAARNYGDLGAYDPEVLGVNARMSEFNAALALAGLDLVDRKLARHNEIAARYTESLRSLPGVSFQHSDARDTHTYKDYSVLIDPAGFGATRDQTAAVLASMNIETKKYFYPPLHQQRLYRQYHDTPLPQTERVSSTVLSLPVYESLRDEQVDAVCEAVQTAAAAVRV